MNLTVDEEKFLEEMGSEECLQGVSEEHCFYPERMSQLEDGIHVLFVGTDEGMVPVGEITIGVNQ